MEHDRVRVALNDVRLMIATPCFGGLLTSGYMHSVMGFTRLATSLPLPFDLATIANESLVARARNMMVRMFLGSDATHLLFIDADIEFEPFDVLRLLMHDRPVVCAEYPMKGVHFENLVNRPVHSVDDALRATTRYTSHLKEADDPVRGGRHIHTEAGLVAVEDAGAGFMCIQRQVIERMIDTYDLAYRSDDPTAPGDCYAVFDTGIRDGDYLSEDYWFCRRWQDMGGEVWLDPQIVLNHVGSYTFRGVRQPYGDLLAE